MQMSRVSERKRNRKWNVYSFPCDSSCRERTNFGNESKFDKVARVTGLLPDGNIKNQLTATSKCKAVNVSFLLKLFNNE